MGQTNVLRKCDKLEKKINVKNTRKKNILTRLNTAHETNMQNKEISFRIQLLTRMYNTCKKNTWEKQRHGNIKYARDINLWGKMVWFNECMGGIMLKKTMRWKNIFI